MDEFEARTKLREQRKNIKSFDDLIAFLKDIKENYNYDYGVTPRAIAQAALATAYYFASDFGITGFQAGFTMWDFILDWQYSSNKCGMKIVNYDDMLYPQFNYKFEKHISAETFHEIQEEAKRLIDSSGYAHPNVIKHWKSIVEGKVPFGYILKDD